MTVGRQGLRRARWRVLPAETLETALQRFRTHPVQTALTLTGLVVGTAAIILIVALGLTGRALRDAADRGGGLAPRLGELPGHRHGRASSGDWTT